MKKLLSLLLVFELFAMMPCLATQINMKVEDRIQRGGKRAPSAVQVSAYYENGVVTVDVSRYYGEAQVFVYDSNGAVFPWSVSINSLFIPTGNETYQQIPHITINS